jgi:triacylglycerol lipase
MKSPFPFDPTATEYHPGNAAFLCEAAAQAYDSAESCRQWASENGFTEGFHFIDTREIEERTGTQGFVAQSPAAILVSFRGTEPKHIADLTSDARAHRTTWEGLAGVHTGFFRAFFAAWGKDFDGVRIFPDLLRNHGGRKIWITGHSLGGALAQVCATQTELRDRIPVHAVYTYGQPRVGDEQFAQTMHEKLGHKIFRLVNDRDIVPRVPFYSLGYRHYGGEFFFDKSHTKAERTSSVETLLEALESYRKTVRFDELQGILHGVLGGVGELLTGSGGDESVLRKLEESIDAKKVAAEGKEKISDHLMKSGYKPLFIAT